MERLHSQTSDRRPPLGTRALAALVLIGAAWLGASSLADGRWAGGQAPFAWIWRDVAIVHVLCAVPLAWMLASFIRRQAPPAGSVVLAAALLGVSIVPFTDATR